MPATSRRRVVKETAEDRRHLGLDIGNDNELLVQLALATFAVPLETVGFVRTAHPLHHQADGVSRPARRMRRVSWQQQHLALADGHIDQLAVLYRSQRDVALELVEELIARIDVKIAAIIGAADDHDDEFAVAEQQFVADRRLELRPVRVDP